MRIYRIKIYPEMCCEECGEIVHNHMDCPICGAKYVDTDVYADLCEFDVGEKVLRCQECGSEFILREKEGYHDNWSWELVSDVDEETEDVIQRLSK